MSEKPILFSTPMVQAILAGRKTQTRRVVKPQPVGSECYGICTDSTASRKDIGKIGFGSADGGITEFYKLRYQPGDVLWVRETWRATGVPVTPYAYRADKEDIFLAGESGNVMGIRYHYKPSIHMPRAAARIFLRVMDVQVERVQEININDMVAEGVIDKRLGGQWQQLQREYYAPLWDSLNAKRGFGWDSNPFVWVISFERVEV